LSSLHNILTFINSNGYPKSSWEEDAGLANGTFYNYHKRNAELPPEAIAKLSKKWGDELRAAGYHIINVDPFGGEILAILNQEEMDVLIHRRNELVHKPVTTAIGQNFEAEYFRVLERERKALEEDKAFFKEILKTSLAVILVDVQSISSRQKGSGEVILHALEEIGQKDPGSLVKKADKRIRQIEKGAYKHDNEAAPGR